MTKRNHTVLAVSPDRVTTKRNHTMLAVSSLPAEELSLPADVLQMRTDASPLPAAGFSSPQDTPSIHPGSDLLGQHSALPSLPSFSLRASDVSASDVSPLPAAGFSSPQVTPGIHAGSDLLGQHSALPSLPSFSSRASDVSSSDESSDIDLEDFRHAAGIFAHRRINLSGDFGQDNSWMQGGHRQFQEPEDSPTSDLSQGGHDDPFLTSGHDSSSDSDSEDLFAELPVLPPAYSDDVDRDLAEFRNGVGQFADKGPVVVLGVGFGGSCLWKQRMHSMFRSSTEEAPLASGLVANADENQALVCEQPLEGNASACSK